MDSTNPKVIPKKDKGSAYLSNCQVLMDSSTAAFVQNITQLRILNVTVLPNIFT